MWKNNKFDQQVTKITATAFIAFMVGAALRTDGASWTAPFLMFGMLIIPFWLGYDIGKKEE